MSEILCQKPIKDNHGAFYFGDSGKKQCQKIAVNFINGLHVCEHHFNKMYAKIERKKLQQANERDRG